MSEWAKGKEPFRTWSMHEWLTVGLCIWVLLAIILFGVMR